MTPIQISLPSLWSSVLHLNLNSQAVVVIQSWSHAYSKSDEVDSHTAFVSSRALTFVILLLLRSCFSFTECLIKELVKCVTAENTMVMDDEDFLLDQTRVKFLWVLFLSSLDLRLRPLSPVLARNLLGHFSAIFYPTLDIWSNSLSLTPGILPLFFF